MNITYRDADIRDAEALDRLFDASFCDTFGHLYRPEDLSKFLSSAGIADWEEEIADPAYKLRVAEVRGEPAGYAKLGPLKLSVEARGPALLLDQIYVLTEHHGAGIGRELVAWAIEEARSRGARELFLTVHPDNHRARRLYERHGFEETGRHIFMVGDHADEDFVMRRTL